MGIPRRNPGGKLLRPTEVEELSIPEVQISSVNSEDTILTTVYFQYGKERAIVDIGAKISLIYLKTVKRLGILY